MTLTASRGSTLNRDYERRPYWHATMPAVPSYRERPLPDTADVVVIGGGYTGINAARVLARAGAAVTLLEAEHLGFGGSTRNGGIVHPGYKWGPQELIDRYGGETGRALYRETLDAYDLVKRLIADEAIDCEFRETGFLDVAWAASHADHLRAEVETLRRFGVDAEFVPKERLHEEIGSSFYHGGMVYPGSGLLHPGKYFAGLAAAARPAK
jgi:glycine/D-amino acid oxidase-like deaminating enzyme